MDALNHIDRVFLTVGCSLSVLAAPSGRAKAQLIAPVAPALPAARGKALDLTLVEAVALALRSNWTVRATYIQRVAERYDLWVAEQRFVPRIGASASEEIEKVDDRSSRTASLGVAGTWLAPTGAIVDFDWAAIRRTRDGSRGLSQTRGVTVTQPLLRGGGIAIATAPVRLARLQNDISRLNVRNTVAGVITAVVSAYRAVIQARDQVEVANAALDRSRQQIMVNRALVTAGRLASADLVQNEADIASQELSLLQTERAADSARLALLRLLALDLHTKLGTLDILSPQPVHLDFERLLSIAQTHRIDLLGQEKSVEQARIGVQLARNDRLWDFSAVGSVGDNRTPGLVGGDARTTSGSIGLRLSVPLLDPSRAQGEVNARTALKTAELQLENLRQQVEADVRDLTAQVDSSWLQLQASDRARHLAAQALSVAQKKLQVGRASNFEVLTLQAGLRAADTQRLSATIGYLNSLTNLDLQLGTTVDTWRIDLND